MYIPNHPIDLVSHTRVSLHAKVTRVESAPLGG